MTEKKSLPYLVVAFCLGLTVLQVGLKEKTVMAANYRYMRASGNSLRRPPFRNQPYFVCDMIPVSAGEEAASEAAQQPELKIDSVFTADPVIFVGRQATIVCLLR